MCIIMPFVDNNEHDSEDGHPGRLQEDKESTHIIDVSRGISLYEY